MRLLATDDETRKDLILEYLGMLSDATCIQVGGYSIMDNHLHLLLHVKPRQADGWSAQEVVRRWSKLHPPRDGYFDPMEVDDDFVESLASDSEWIELTRKKLSSISQYMKELKQRIAQQANRVDKATGAFWGERFRIKRVENDEQLLATMAYIDVNPFAAGMCPKPEDGQYTSLEVHLSRHAKNRTIRSNQTRVRRVGRVSKWLLPLRKSSHSKREPLLQGMSLRVYLQVIDRTARLMREGKKVLRGDTRPITERIRLSSSEIRDRIIEIQYHWEHYLPKPAAAS